MLVVGAGIYITSMVQFMMDFPKGKLITRGVYRLSRNPLYSSWILLILPGLALVCNNWFFLLAAFSMYISLIVLIKEEEDQFSPQINAFVGFWHITQFCMCMIAGRVR